MPYNALTLFACAAAATKNIFLLYCCRQFSFSRKGFGTRAACLVVIYDVYDTTGHRIFFSKTLFEITPIRRMTGCSIRVFRMLKKFFGAAWESAVVYAVKISLNDFSSQMQHNVSIYYVLKNFTNYLKA